MKHIVLITPTLGGGGAERTTLLLANGLADLGYQVTLAVANIKGEKGKLKSELSNAVELLDLDCDRMINFLIPFSKWLKQHQPDVVVSSQMHTNIIVYTAARLAGYNGKLIAREVSTSSVNLKHLSGLKKWLTQFVIRYIYQRIHALVAVSKGVADDLSSYVNKTFSKMRVIYDPVITDDLYKKAQQPLAHPWFSEDRGVQVILAVGRLTEAKNYPLLIKAFAQLIKNTPAHLMILGEGEDRTKLEMLISDLGVQDQVSLAGFDNNPFRYMARCDLYVMSSNWEGLPGALIQALALGARVVSTDCPSGPREILKNGLYGTLVKVDCVDSLSTALFQRLREEKSIRNSMNVGSEFKLNVVLKQYTSLF